MLYRSLIRPLLFLYDAEQAHQQTGRLLKSIQQYDAVLKFLEDQLTVADTSLEVRTSGITFPNPTGLAAGFDKNAELIPALSAAGFGFLEVGSVTFRPAPGNPVPRMFRLPKDEALINRMGLNNHGAEEVAERLSAITRRIPVGVNIAKTPVSHKNTDSAIQDYVSSYNVVKHHADYITLNISCPNTSDGTTFEDSALLIKLLKAIEPHRLPDLPLFVKFSADAGDETIIRLLEVCESLGINGYAAVNTTTSRNQLKSTEGKINRIGQGGLSGKPLQKRARECVRLIRNHVDNEKTIISVGGIDSGEEAATRIHLGANLVQLYSGLVYQGPGLPGRICRHLIQAR